MGIYGHWLRVVFGSALLVLAASLHSQGGKIEDAESSTHGFDAAKHQVVEEYHYASFKLIQFELPVLSHYSYLLVSEGEALVIDPGRDVLTYLDSAKREKATIRGVYLTHSHADFVAGHTEIAGQLKTAEKLSVPIYISEKAGASYEHRPLKEGDTIPVGGAVVKILETPGHTPDSTCGLVSAKQDSAKPSLVLTGDTLFIGSVGRPDLLGEDMAASSLASMLFDTWTKKLSKLPDDVLVFPAHGAGSLCGAHLSDSPTSTLGEQRVSNPYLQHRSRGQFVAAVLEGLPEAPQYFQHNAAMNRQGPPQVEWNPRELPMVEPSRDLIDASKYYVVDLREAEDYAAGHIPNAVAIALRGRLETWVGIMVPWGSSLVVAGDPEQVREAIFRLHRVGYQAKGLDIEQWKKAGLPMASHAMIAPRELYSEMQSQDSPLVVDVRLPSEWMGLRIGTVANIPLNKLVENVGKLDRRQKVVAVCNSAYRSTMALGILERAGFQNATSLAGGSEAWIEAGLPVQEAGSETAAGATSKRQVRLAERISAAELKRMLMDLPGTFHVVDIRPADQYADYSLPGSENVEVAALLENPAYLTGAGPLVVVDRDGSLGMMVAGILSQKTQRPIKALYGGLAGYWQEADLGATSAGTPIPAVSPTGKLRSGQESVRPSITPKASPPVAQPVKPVSKPKRKSAGC